MNAAHGHRVAGTSERRFYVSYGALSQAPPAELRTLASVLAENSRRGVADAAARRLYVRVLAELARRRVAPKPK